MFSIRTLLSLCSLIVLAAARPPQAARTSISSPVSNSQSSLTLLYQNNLNASDDINHVGAILLDPMSQKDASTACASIGETLLPQSTLKEHQTDFLSALSYQAFAGRALPIQQYYIDGGVALVTQSLGDITFPSIPFLGDTQLPVLCTQSSNQNQPANAVATSRNELAVASGGNTFVGFRNQKSFRFLGIPFADPPARFEYSQVYSTTDQTIEATQYGSDCAQPGEGSENCLFINIQTPYIPKAGSKANLRPVMFWIYGGGFVDGSGADPLSDGGNLASREDIVVVQVNYRLSTLGFLTIPGTNVTGNYGIGDQITGLEWTIANIAQFGGDPTKITINGESAGAGSVRTLLGSPKAIGKFQGAISMSNLGGGVDLGLSGDYGSTYSSYLTPVASYAQAGQQVFIEAGCTNSTLSAQIACLKAVPATTIVGLETEARFVTQDGAIVDTEQLIVSTKNGSAAHVPIIFGNVANDGASFSTYPTTPVASELEGIQAALSISEAFAQSIINSGLFPYYDTGNVTLDSFNVSQRVATDNQFRCIDQATVFAGQQTGVFPVTYYYQMDRTINGYDPNNLGGAPVTPGFPFGNPNLPYFKLHGSDMPWVFGNLDTIRDPADLYSVQVGSAYFGSFVRTGNPNPSQEYLNVRGYTQVSQNMHSTGPWNPVTNAEGSIKLIDYPAKSSGFQDLEQCQFLNYSISYYLDSNRG